MRRRDGKRLSVRTPRTGRVEELQTLEVRIGRRLRELPLNATRLAIGDKQVEREKISLREERDHAAVRTDAWANVVAAAAIALIDERLRLTFKRRLLRDHCLRQIPNGLVPISGEGVRVCPQLPREPDEIIAWIRRSPHERGNHSIAVLRSDERPERMAPAVREILRVVEVLDLGQLLANGGVAKPHSGLGINRSQREVLGHALDEPERKIDDARRRGRRVAWVVARHVELEGMDQFVAEHMICVGE
jgi:hypothetical protein